MERKRGFFVFILAVLVATIIFSGCRRPRIEPPRFKLVVLDFQLLKEPVTPKEIKGWWFGARDIYYNPNVGEKFADALAEEIKRRCPFIDVYSRLDLKYYLVSKKELLRRNFSQLKKEEIGEIIRKLDPIDIGRDLGVEKVITGVIYESHTSHHRTFHWWSSVIGAELKLIDVDSGELEWDYKIRKRKKFLSWLGTAEAISARLVKLMNKEVFYK